MEIPNEQSPKSKGNGLRANWTVTLSNKNPFFRNISRKAPSSPTKKREANLGSKCRRAGSKDSESEGELTTERQSIKAIALPEYVCGGRRNIYKLEEEKWAPNKSPPLPLKKGMGERGSQRSGTPPPVPRGYISKVAGGKPPYPKGPPTTLHRLLQLHKLDGPQGDNPMSVMSSVDGEGEGDGEGKGMFDQQFLVLLKVTLKWLPTQLNRMVLPRGRYSTNKTIIIDFDETLIYCPFPDNLHNIHIVPNKSDTFNYPFYIRPYTLQFITKLSKIAELILYSSGDSTYLIDILSTMRIKQYFSYILSRDNCSHFKGGMVKSLQIINRALENTLILDDNISVWPLELDNIFPITRFFGDPSDRELSKIYPQVVRLLGKKDLQVALRRKFHLRDKLREFRDRQREKKKEVDKRRKTVDNPHLPFQWPKTKEKYRASFGGIQQQGKN